MLSHAVESQLARLEEVRNEMRPFHLGALPGIRQHWNQCHQAPSSIPDIYEAMENIQ